MKPSSTKTKASTHPKERRIYNRKPHSGSIFFATKNQLFEGELLNYSQAGVCIRASEKFAEGEKLVVALPFDDASPAKCLARVIWCNGRGFGARLVR
jgi:PilZ domain